MTRMLTVDHKQTLMALVQVGPQPQNLLYIMLLLKGMGLPIQSNEVLNNYRKRCNIETV